MEAGTTVQITMPQMGDSVTEGTVLEWLKQVGDQVEPNETLLEVSTDKVDAEVPAPIGGTLVRILVEADETVPVGTVLGEIDTDGGSPAPDEERGGEGGADLSDPGATEMAQVAAKDERREVRRSRRRRAAADGRVRPGGHGARVAQAGRRPGL